MMAKVSKHILHDLKEIIMQTEEPLKITDFLTWQIFAWNLDKWKDVLKCENLEFRCGLNQKTEYPQWERTSKRINGKFEDLLKFSDPDRWLYFDYKYMNQFLLNAKGLRESIQFEDLGLPNINVGDTAIWIGTKGAHTPCHIDTYGCNVVIQIYGRKQWLLFPPDENLKPSRIPYEESSIYSNLNFFSPTNLSQFKDIQNCKIVTLNPGDVLIIPPKWWHYVENLELSISINAWLPMPGDDMERIKECLVKLLVSSLSKDLNRELKNDILNPNSEDALEFTADSAISLLNNLKKSSSLTSVHREIINSSLLQIPLDQWKIDYVPKRDFNLFLENQCQRFGNSIVTNENTDEIDIKSLMNAITQPDVMNLVISKLMK